MTSDLQREPRTAPRKLYEAVDWDRRPRVPPASQAAKNLSGILALSDIRVNGNRPWDVQVFDDRMFQRVLSEGSLGAGESYMDGWWDVEALDEFFARIHRLNLYESLDVWNAAWLAFKARIFNFQDQRRSPRVAAQHYDLGNDLYESMLGGSMQYTCAYWNGAASLDEAQENKLRLVAKKLHVTRGMRVLELGSGFGGLARLLAKDYGCQVVSYNISTEQVANARRLCAGLPVRFERRDYREAENEREPFDRVVSVGLCEHVGYRNYRGFLELARRKLMDGGLFLLHTIGGNESEANTDPWMDRYIFPGGVIPSIAQFGKAMERLWVVEDWHNFGPDYDPTLLAWYKNFERAWPSLRTRYGDRFRRMWRFYLLGSAGAFRARKLQLWQIVLSKGDIASYVPVR